jgi:hypothetical protein
MNIFLYSSASRNIILYIHQCYVPWLFCRLTKEFTIYSSIIQLNTSVVTNEYFVVSCSVDLIIEHSIDQNIDESCNLVLI